MLPSVANPGFSASTAIQRARHQRRRRRTDDVADLLTSLCGFRSAPPELAARFRACAEVDRKVLPRRHQDDRGPRGSVRGFHVQAAPGAYAHIPVWHGREHFLNVVVPAAFEKRSEVRQHLAAQGKTLPSVGRATFLLWARIESLYVQDQRTGRRLVACVDVVASLMDMRDRTVQRCRELAKALGILVDVLPGRMLTFPERLQAQAGGSRQRGLSTESALTVPAWAHSSRDFVTPSRGSTSEQKISPDYYLPDRSAGSAAKTDATPSRRPDEKGTRRRRRAASVAVELARSVRQTVPWTAAEPPGVLAGALARFAAAEPGWSGADVAAAIAATDARMGWSPVTTRSIKTRPVAILAAYLRGLDVHADHPGADLSFPDVEPVELVPCDRDDCDGHGWITTTQGGRDVVAKCPGCPARIRDTH